MRLVARAFINCGNCGCPGPQRLSTFTVPQPSQSAAPRNKLRFAAWLMLVATVSSIHIILPLQLGVPVPQPSAPAIARIQLSAAPVPAQQTRADANVDNRPAPASLDAPRRTPASPKPHSQQSASMRTPPDEPTPQTAPVSAVAASAPGTSANRLEYSVTGRRNSVAFGGSARMLWTQTSSGYWAAFEITASQGYTLLFYQRMESDGRVTPEGLVSESFKEEHRPAHMGWPAAANAPASPETR